MACNGALGTDKTPEPPGSALESEAFLTPVAQAREGGVAPYWLGERFNAGGVTFGASGVASLYEDASPSLHLEYAGRSPTAQGELFVETYPQVAPDARSRLERFSSQTGASPGAVRVGDFDAEIAVSPGGDQPAENLLLLVHAEGADVVVRTTGVLGGPPGDIRNLNPLTDEDLFIQVVAENLQPIPE
ncbi:MAG: hypothetical protein WEE64_08695 [Dehalococcoidia bacterium]